MPKYIELEKALESLQHKYENMYGCNPSFYAGYQFALDNLKRIKSADAAPVVHGKWEFEPETINTYSVLKCSKCGWWTLDLSVDGSYHYCPSCGSKMILEDD